MPSPGQSTWDGNPLATPPVTTPYRPGTPDFDGAAWVDDPYFPPDPTTMPTAAQWRTVCKLLVAMGRLCPNATISVTGGTSPSISSFAAMPSAVVLATFTVTRNGPGDVSITWPANTFPPPVTGPKAFLNGTTSGMIDCVGITNGVRVYTFNTAGTATDYSFTVDVM